MLRIRIRALGTIPRRRRVASMPSIPGIEMSVMMRSGLRRSAAVRSSRPLVASPTTSYSGSRSFLRPASIIGWLSASSTLVSD
jgi:hypothetical protein